MIKNQFFFFLFLFISTSCSQEKKVKVEVGNIKFTVNNIVDNWHKDAAEGNHEAYIGAMSKNGTYIGTDASENWQTEVFKEWSKPYFDNKNSWSFTPLERNVYVTEDGKVAWFDEVLNTKMGVCRGSGILQNSNGKWEINHYVLSIAIPNENIGEIIKINHEKDSVIVKSYSKN